MISYSIVATLAAVATLSSASRDWPQHQDRSQFKCPSDWKSLTYSKHTDVYNPRFYYECAVNIFGYVFETREACPEYAKFNESTHECEYESKPDHEPEFRCPKNSHNLPYNRYPYKGNPRKYYYCWGSQEGIGSSAAVVTTVEDCPEYTEFNQNIHNCWYVNGPSFRPNKCPEDYKSRSSYLYPDSHIPWKYYSCETGKPVTHMCWRNEVFNDIINECVPENIPADAQQFQCPDDWKTRSYTFYPDEYHPNFFYSCFGDGQKPRYRWFRCPPTHVFLESKHDCVPKAKIICESRL